MHKYIEFVSRNRKKLILLLICLNILAIAGVLQLDINAEFDIFKINNSHYLKTLDEMDEVFGVSEQTMLLIKSDDNIMNSMALTDQALENHVDFISPIKLLSLFNEEATEASFENLGPLSPIIQINDEKYITYRLNTRKEMPFDEIIQSLEAADLEFYFSGDTYMQYEIVNLVVSVLIFIPPIALALVLLTFRSQLSSFKAALLSVIPAGLAALWTLGIVGWFGGEVSVITVLAPIFAIVIGSADGLHFVTHMEEELSHDSSRTHALSHTLSIVGIPMIITTTTSVAGFLGLLMINTSAIQDLAIFASLGVFLAGVVTWYVLPLIFSGAIELKHNDKKSHNIWLKNLWGKKSIVIATLLILSASVFIPNIKSEFNQLIFFRDFTTVQKNFKKINEVNGGAIPIFYYGQIGFDEREAKINEFNDFLNLLESDEHISKVINPLSLTNQIMNPSLSMLNAAKDFIQIKNDQIYFRIMVFPENLENETIDHIESLNIYSPVKGEFTGVQFLMKEMNASIVKGQVLSILLTLALIIIMLRLTLKSFKLTLISSLPIVLTSIILYGFLGLTGISLNLMTCTIFSITLGIGVDYAIHFTSVYKYYKDNNHATPIETAFQYTSRPIIANAFGLSLGMTALWISPLLIHIHISSLMWISMMVAVFMSLTLLPTLLEKK